MENRTRGRRITVQGVVKSAKMDKTIVVEIQRLVQHPVYKKYINRRTTYYAHDPQNTAHEGDKVEIVAAKPTSKKKRWRLVKVLGGQGASS